MYDDKVYVDIIKSYLQKNGFDVSSYSKNTFLKQLHQRMQSNNYSTYETYHSFLQENEEEFTQLKNSFSINVTSFFRDPEVYEAFRVFFAIYLKEILQRNHRSKIRIWSAGCANGSEPYSIVINLHQTLKKHLNDYSIRIFATDINSEVLSTAKAGIYEETIKEEVPKEILNQYFCQNPQGRFSISNNIKKYVSFSELDLLSNRFHFDYIDIIFCRYVLMYFKESQQKLLMRKFFDLLNPGGLLILGRTDPMPFVEQNIFLPTSDNIFFPLSNEERIYQKPLALDQREKILMDFPDEILFCEWCGKPFFTIKKLKEHLEHTSCQSGNFSCYICRKDLFSKTGLIAHLKYSHYIDRSNEISLIFNKNRQF